MALLLNANDSVNRSYTITKPSPNHPLDVVGVGTLDSGQYKIPISSGGVTTDIYLGSTQTVRKIKKLVLDGSETWYINNRGTVNAFFSMVLANPLNVNLGISTHFEFKGIYTSNTDVGFYVTTNGELRIRPDNVSSMTKSDFTTWLATQYANGTPATVWYVLATPETAAVNEPLMKIGTYADTLSNATAIPTTEGANSITVDTTVQTSEFTATWTGWHNATVKEKSRNLFDKNNNIVNYYLASTNGAYQATSGMSRSIKLKISPSSVYSITLTSYTKRIGFFENEPTDNDVPVAFYNNDTNEYSQSSFTITSPASANYMVIFCYNSSKEYQDGKTINEVMSSVMVNTGSTALPYEPYWQ